ncbi:hypothetical protein ACEPW6_29070, partial [Pseudomonas aeruginosa]
IQPLRQQAHPTGRLPLNLLFQQNRPETDTQLGRVLPESGGPLMLDVGLATRFNHEPREGRLLQKVRPVLLPQ